MCDLFLLAIHLIVTVAKFLRPGGVRAVAAESLLLKHQMLISNRCRHRAPNLTSLDRFVLGLTTLFISPQRIAKLAAILRPVTLLKFQKALVDRKYRLLFSPSATRCKPGPKRPSAELIAAIVELKSRNPKFGYLRIAQQISHAFGVDIDKDVVRRVLAKHYLSSAIIGSTAFPLTDLGMAVASSERDRCCPDSLPLLGGPPPFDCVIGQTGTLAGGREPLPAPSAGAL
jgi:putative transposase